jgi:hypothetical protein
MAQPQSGLANSGHLCQARTASTTKVMQLSQEPVSQQLKEGHESKLIGTPWGRPVPCRERCEPLGIYKSSGFYYIARKLKGLTESNAKWKSPDRRAVTIFHKSGSAVLWVSLPASLPSSSFWP